jgi:hypothetical protein
VVAGVAATVVGERATDVTRRRMPTEALSVGRCSCGFAGCGSPGAHPAVSRWQDRACTDLGVVNTWWSSRRPYNVLLATGERFDVWQAPCDIAYRAMEILDATGVPVGAVARTPEDDLQFYSQPCTGPSLVDRTPLSHIGRSGYVLAPPSRTDSGQYTWWRQPAKGAFGALPPWRPLVQALRAACGAAPARLVVPDVSTVTAAPVPG